MDCPNCKVHWTEHPIVKQGRKNYIFRKYHCSYCDKSFHTHEYLQDTRNEPALKARLQEIAIQVHKTQVQLNKSMQLLQQLELSL